MAKPKAKAKILDFTNVKERGEYNPKHQPEGDYLAKIVSVDDTDAKSGNPMWTFGIQLADQVSATYPYRCTLNAESLWKVRNLCVSTGITVPKSKLKVDPNKLLGKMVGVSLIDDEYEGKMKSVIDSVFPPSELPTDDNGDAPKKSKKKKAPVEDDVEEEPTPPAKKAKKGKKAKKNKVADEDLEELDVEEL